jgi:hypothetical protein
LDITLMRRRRSLAVGLAAVCGFASVSAVSGAAFARTPGMPHDATRLTDAQRTVLLDATRRFRDVEQAVEAGYLPTKDCVPGMGFHYVKPKLATDTNIDPVLPEILVYTRGPDATVRLAALEYFRADDDQKLKTDEDRPTLFGHPFNGPMMGHPVPAGQPPMPVHYDLHVWLYQTNPSGELAPDNPEVHC